VISSWLAARRIVAISRFDSRDRGSYGPRINDRIRVTQVRLLDENNQMIGVVETAQALSRAREVGLDLVEVSSQSTPPVCRIMDYGKFKYEQSKKDKANKAKSKGSELKEVRLGRSMKIDPHDVGIRIAQARRFLLDGDKVQIVQNFRGREMSHRGRGDDRMQDIIDRLSDIGKVEVPPRMAGRRMTMIFAPDRAKIEALRKKAAAAGLADPTATLGDQADADHQPSADIPDDPTGEASASEIHTASSAEKS
jgi:translation initiation factor IF-3